jgi:hypothetical protein
MLKDSGGSPRCYRAALRLLQLVQDSSIFSFAFFIISGNRRIHSGDITSDRCYVP